MDGEGDVTGSWERGNDENGVDGTDRGKRGWWNVDDGDEGCG
jgi:hypothetical protein